MEKENAERRRREEQEEAAEAARLQQRQQQEEQQRRADQERQQAETVRKGSLFVFLIVGPKQNAGSLFTHDSDTVFYALSHGTLGFALNGSFNNHLFQRI